MKNKKGFTLIELLAVIVILAIIALIATPIILNMINDARKSAAVDSAYGYIEAVEYQNSMTMLNTEKYNKIADGENIDVKTIDSLVKVKGTRPDSGTLTIEKSRVKNADLCINGFNIIYDGEKASATDSTKCGSSSEEKQPEEVKYKVYKTGKNDEVDIIYYNPVTNTSCTNYVEANSSNNVKEGCMKWYVIENSGEDKSTVDVILDHNTTSTVYFNKSGKATEIKEAKDELNKLVLETQWKVVPRLISADEILKIIEYDTWDKVSQFYFETKTSSIPNIYTGIYGWLYDHTYQCESYGCNKEESGMPIGYWTSTIKNDYDVWSVDRDGTLWNKAAYYGDRSGIRPVITIEKSLIK